MAIATSTVVAIIGAALKALFSAINPFKKKPNEALRDVHEELAESDREQAGLEEEMERINRDQRIKDDLEKPDSNIEPGGKW